MWGENYTIRFPNPLVGAALAADGNHVTKKCLVRQAPLKAIWLLGLRKLPMSQGQFEGQHAY